MDVRLFSFFFIKYSRDNKGTYGWSCFRNHDRKYDGPNDSAIYFFKEEREGLDIFVTRGRRKSQQKLQSTLYVVFGKLSQFSLAFV